jgi:predicted nucleotidyltransferase
MHPTISEHLVEIAQICKRYNVRRLELFGSAARDSGFSDASDADFLVEFESVSAADLHSFFGIKFELEKLLGVNVDLVEVGSVRNPYVLASMNRDRQSVYGP